MTESMRVTTHTWPAARSASTSGHGLLTGLWSRLGRARTARRRQRIWRVDQLPVEALRDVDPALHDALTGLYASWNGLDNRFRPTFY